MGLGVRRAICARSLDLREWIVGAARLSFEIGTLLDGKALVEDIAFHMGLRLERCSARQLAGARYATHATLSH